MENLKDMRHETRDTIIIQGIIDMLIKSPDELIVIDFKTDNVTKNQIAEHAKRYYGQLEFYSRAAQNILKTGIFGKCLYFLTPNKAFEITD